MNTRPLSAVLAAVAFFAATAAGAEEQKARMSREQAEHFAKTVNNFSVNGVARPAVNKVMTGSSAGYWALWDLLNDLSARQKTDMKPEPDLELAETYIRLRVRSTSGGLCSGFSGNCKEYPEDAQLAKAAQNASKEIRAYAGKFKAAQDFAGKTHRDRITRLLESAKDRVFFFLPMTTKNSVEVPPPSEGESKYLQLSLSKKQGEKFSFPPWP